MDGLSVICEIPIRQLAEEVRLLLRLWAACSCRSMQRGRGGSDEGSLASLRS
jgi:hypothetical protein